MDFHKFWDEVFLIFHHFTGTFYNFDHLLTNLVVKQGYQVLDYF